MPRALSALLKGGAGFRGWQGQVVPAPGDEGRAGMAEPARRREPADFWPLGIHPVWWGVGLVVFAFVASRVVRKYLNL